MDRAFPRPQAFPSDGARIAIGLLFAKADLSGSWRNASTGRFHHGLWEAASGRDLLPSRRNRKPLGFCQDLLLEHAAGIEDTFGVERSFDPAHHVQLDFALYLCQQPALHPSDTMLR